MATTSGWRHARPNLLRVPYFDVVFTLPSAIGDVAYQNKAVIYDLLFKASSEAMLTIAADPKHLGARIGITAVLHSWGSAMTHHPHVHMIVPGGGISLDGGKGSMLGALTGVLLLGVVQNLLTLAQVPSFWIQAIYGAIILGSLMVARLASGEGQN